MVKLHSGGAWLLEGKEWLPDNEDTRAKLEARLGKACDPAAATRETMAYAILAAHNTSDSTETLKLRFDAMASHDITYVGIVQTARASGLTHFPLPYVLTNCHNSLCAVGGTINEDDHMFGLSAAKKYGGIYVPAHQAVIHQYMREMQAGCGKMLLGSDSHTRYGALGTLAVGEGGPELVKQLLGKTYDIDRPAVVAVHLTGKLQHGVGPQDVALAIIGEVFPTGFVKNRILEFVGDAIAQLSMDDRIGIDVMTTETTCLSSIWETDSAVSDYFAMHGRPEAYRALHPGALAYYDGMIEVDLSRVKPMIALPFHPSNTYTIEALSQNLTDILGQAEEVGRKQLGNNTFSLRDKIKNGRLMVQQGVIGGCAGGTYENLCEAANILDYASVGLDEFSLSLYPSSQPVNLALTENGVIARLMRSGATVRTAFCGPCFGAGDTPANNGLSVRHTTRNFPNREGAKPGNGQIASVALMDARSVAATAANGGLLTAATDVNKETNIPKFFFEGDLYSNRCYNGVNNPDPSVELRLGPGIADWPVMQPLAEDLLLRVVSVITDPVTTTDELIPSGETSSYRSNPMGLAEYTLSRKDPAYVGKAKAVKALEDARLSGGDPAAQDESLAQAMKLLEKECGFANKRLDTIGIGSVIFAIAPGDGSAREQAASCQKVLGTFANIASEYATKRYRSNLINWGMLPFLCEERPFQNGDWLYVPGARRGLIEHWESFSAYVLAGETARPFTLRLASLTDDERKILLAGCLINFYKNNS